MGDGKWETNGVKVNHPTPRLGFDAFESRSTLADPRSISPVPPLSSIGTRWRTRIATIREKLGTLTNGSGINTSG